MNVDKLAKNNHHFYERKSLHKVAVIFCETEKMAKEIELQAKEDLALYDLAGLVGKFLKKMKEMDKAVERMCLGKRK